MTNSRRMKRLPPKLRCTTRYPRSPQAKTDVAVPTTTLSTDISAPRRSFGCPKSRRYESVENWRGQK